VDLFILVVDQVIIICSI